MTRTISSVISALFMAMLLLIAAPKADAVSAYWDLNLSTPASTLQTSTFNLDYQVVYTDVTDAFTVQLIANGSNVIQTQSVGNNGKFADSGRFTVPNVPNGTYTYKVKAIRTSDNDTKESATRTVTIAVPSATVVVINRDSTTTSTDDTATSESADQAQSATAIAATNDTEQIAATTDAVTETSSDTATTGVEGEQTSGSNSTARNIAVIGLIIAAIGGAAWLILSRQNKEVS